MRLFLPRTPDREALVKALKNLPPLPERERMRTKQTPRRTLKPMTLAEWKRRYLA